MHINGENRTGSVAVVMDIDATGQPSGRSASMARHLKSLDRSARTTVGPLRAAVKQQIDAAWQHTLRGAANAQQATCWAAEVAGCILGQPLPPASLDQARRLGAGVAVDDPFPFVAASLYALLGAWEAHDQERFMENAFGRLNVASEAPGWAPQPAAPNGRRKL